MPAGFRRDLARTAFLSTYAREEPSMLRPWSMWTTHVRSLADSCSSENDATLQPFGTAQGRDSHLGRGVLQRLRTMCRYPEASG